MASPLEPLRLFDLDTDPGPSQNETKGQLSHSVTPRTQFQIETELQESPTEDLLRAIRRAARMVADADCELVAAIEGARAGRCSWREIGNAAGVAHQTLHHRHQAGRSDHGT